jgi:hypothetical protein
LSDYKYQIGYSIKCGLDPYCMFLSAVAHRSTVWEVSEMMWGNLKILI